MIRMDFNGTPVFVGNITEGELNDFLISHTSGKKIIMVDENTHDCCLEYLITAFPALENAEIMLLPAGEENKALEICHQVWTAMLEYRIHRTDLVINLGGGVVTDIGGFIASVFKRGIPFIHLPTSLMAMVDASLGGKNGVDMNGFKNVIGTLQAPEAIFIDPGFLQSLPAEEIFNGFAEMLKHALILDRNYWNQLKDIRDEITLTSQENILQSIAIKKKVVEMDPEEKGMRKLLNFGHTMGHGLESYFFSHNPIAHGHSVALGMIAESYISMKRGILSMSEYLEIEKVIIDIFPMPNIPEEALKDIMEFLHNDKKNEGSGINFVLLISIGHAQINAQLTEKEVGESLLHLSMLAQNVN